MSDVVFQNGKILQGDVMNRIKEVEANSIDEIVTDPPYGYGFMNKDWDKVIVSVDVWKECLRVLKPGAFAFVMSAPRQDVLSHMIVNLTDAGFKTDFTSMYWAYATGFPKAANISKLVDKKGGVGMNKDFCKLIKKKREEANLSLTELSELGHFYGEINHGGTVSNWENQLGIPTLEQYNKLIKILDLGDYPEIKEAKREVISRQKMTIGIGGNSPRMGNEKIISLPETEHAKKLNGSYAGFQPKPAVEVILVCMKPLSEKNYVEQALENGKGVTWFDDCRIPITDLKNEPGYRPNAKNHNLNVRNFFGNTPPGSYKAVDEGYHDSKGRFPANLIVSDNILDDGKNRKSSKKTGQHGLGSIKFHEGKLGDDISLRGYDDEGDFSRYFDLDSWEAQFIITPKPSKSEKNKGLSNFIEQKVNDGRKTDADNAFQRGKTMRKNTHPTVKPVSLFKYLVTLGSRPNDIVLDPFMGSGTLGFAAQQTGRDFIGIERNDNYVKICKSRLNVNNIQRLM